MPATTAFGPTIDTFRVAAEEPVRIDGEVLNLEVSKRAEGCRGFVQRVPVGACSFITLCNFPLNLFAHKVVPAVRSRPSTTSTRRLHA